MDIHQQWRMIKPMDDLRRRLRRPCMLPPKRDSQGGFVLIPAASNIKFPSWMKKKLWEAERNEVDHEEVDDQSESDFGGMISPLSVDFDPGLKTSWSHISVNGPSTESSVESQGGTEGDIEEEEKDENAQDEDHKSQLWDDDHSAFGLDEIDSDEDDTATNCDDAETVTTCEFGRLQKHEGILKTPLDDMLFVMDSWDAEHNMQEVETAFTAVKTELQMYETAYKFQCSTARLPKLNVFAMGKSRKERLQYLRNVIRVLRYQMAILETKRARVQNVMVKIKEDEKNECEGKSKALEVEFEVLRALDAKRDQILTELKVARAKKETVSQNKMISHVIKPIPVYKLLANYTFLTERGRDAAVHLIKPSLSQEVAIINDKDKNLAIQCGHLRREIQRHEQEKKLLKLGYGDRYRTGVYIPEEFSTYNEKKNFINAKIQNYKDEKDSLKKEREGLEEEKCHLVELKSSKKFDKVRKSEPNNGKKFRMPPFNEMTFKQKVLSRQMVNTRARSAKF